MSTATAKFAIWLLAGLIGLWPTAGKGQTVEYVHTDALGSVMAITDAARNVIERREYEPYGQQLTPAVQDGPGYTGHVQDASTGLTYMQQRYYDPGIGRFLSVDPVTADGNTGGNFNRYRYAANNPYRFTDPDGRQERAYGASVGLLLGDQPEKFAIVMRAEQAATATGSGAEQGLAVGAAAGEFARTGDYSKEAVAAVAVKAMIAAVTKGKSGRSGDFTRGQKEAFKRDNAARNGGQMKCDDCGKDVRSVANEKGVSTPPDQAQVHHDPPIKDGGGRSSEGKVLCPECHQDRHKREK